MLQRDDLDTTRMPERIQVPLVFRQPLTRLIFVHFVHYRTRYMSRPAVWKIYRYDTGMGPKSDKKSGILGSGI